jgi:hypothetical protein
MEAMEKETKRDGEKKKEKNASRCNPNHAQIALALTKNNRYRRESAFQGGDASLFHFHRVVQMRVNMNPIVIRARTENAVGRNPMSYRPDPVFRVGIDQGEGMWTGKPYVAEESKSELDRLPAVW